MLLAARKPQRTWHVKAMICWYMIVVCVGGIAVGLLCKCRPGASSELLTNSLSWKTTQHWSGHQCIVEFTFVLGLLPMAGPSKSPSTNAPAPLFFSGRMVRVRAGYICIVIQQPDGREATGHLKVPPRSETICQRHNLRPDLECSTPVGFQLMCHPGRVHHLCIFM